MNKKIEISNIDLDALKSMGFDIDALNVNIGTVSEEDLAGLQKEIESYASKLKEDLEASLKIAWDNMINSLPFELNEEEKLGVKTVFTEGYTAGYIDGMFEEVYKNATEHTTPLTEAKKDNVKYRTSEYSELLSKRIKR